MAFKFRRVKRPRRKSRNPGAATTSLLISGGVALIAILVIRRMMATKDKPALAPAARAAVVKAEAGRYKMSGVDCIDMVAGNKVVSPSLCGAQVVAQLEGVGGIFTAGRGLGSL